MKKYFLIAIMIVIGGFIVLKSHRASDNPAFVISEGYTIEVFAQGLDDPRVIVFDSQNRMLVSETSAGRVTVVGKGPIIENLDNPHGLAFFKNNLYVATTREVARYTYDAENATVDIASKKNIMNLPAGGDHVVRTIGFGKDFRDAPLVAGLPRGSFLSAIKLYASVGSSCDVCLENTWKYAAILEADPEGTYTAEVAGGLRASEFFTFHPTTGALWATEQSRKEFSDEINIIKPTLKYGWPYCYGKQVRDESFTEKTERNDLPMDCAKTEPPEIELPKDTDPLGIAFISPTELLVAYQDKIVRFDEQKQPHDFITGWKSSRPIDIKINSQGDIFISDAKAGVIYKVSSVS